MGFSKEKREQIKEYMLKLINENENPYEKTLKIFKVSRQTLTKYLNGLVNDGILECEGGATRKTYKLKIQSKIFDFKLDSKSDEETVYDKSIKNLVSDLPENVKTIIHYSSTEIINNVIDHSGSKNLSVFIWSNYFEVFVSIKDTGVGIFKKIMKDFDLTSEDEAIFQLHKGKLTSDSSAHSGEGIFFSSRACDQFLIYSYKKVFYSKGEKDRLESHFDLMPGNGTCVIMRYSKKSSKDLIKIFEEYQDESSEGFSKTEVRIKLAEQFAKTLISRSQAKRVLAGFNNFRDIILDFKNVNLIGQGFADQIFRVYKNANPHIKLTPINMNDKVSFMLEHVIERAKELN